MEMEGKKTLKVGEVYFYLFIVMLFGLYFTYKTIKTTELNNYLILDFRHNQSIQVCRLSKIQGSKLLILGKH